VAMIFDWLVAIIACHHLKQCMPERERKQKRTVRERPVNPVGNQRRRDRQRVLEVLSRALRYLVAAMRESERERERETIAEKRDRERFGIQNRESERVKEKMEIN
jgi:hypothetical protein